MRWRVGGLLVVAGLVVVVAAVFFGIRPIDVLNEVEKGTSKTIERQGLGAVCPNEEECISFCLNNRGQCQRYCDEHHENDLCDSLFSAERGQRNEGSVRADTSPCVSNSNPVFSHTFVDLANITVISRYGGNALYNPGSQARSYVSVREGERTRVYAPTNLTITRIYLSDKNYTSFFQRAYVRPEYKVDFQVSCEVRAAYDHLVSLSDTLQVYAPRVSAPGKNEGVVVSIPLQAGDVIGYTSGAFPGRTFDFFFLNYARKAAHLNPSRWTTDHSLYMDCPYDYFSDELKQQYLARIDEENGMPRCGPRVREVPATIQGYWFQGNATETTGPRFALYGSTHFVEWALALGTESPVPYRDQAAGRIDPADVTEGRTACYYDSDSTVYVYVQMLSHDTLALAHGTGVCPSHFPADYDVWER